MWCLAADPDRQPICWNQNKDLDIYTLLAVCMNEFTASNKSKIHHSWLKKKQTLQSCVVCPSSTHGSCNTVSIPLKLHVLQYVVLYDQLLCTDIMISLWLVNKVIMVMDRSNIQNDPSNNISGHIFIKTENKFDTSFMGQVGENWLKIWRMMVNHKIHYITKTYDYYEHYDVIEGCIIYQV